MVFSGIAERLAHADLAGMPAQHNDDPETIAQRTAINAVVVQLKEMSNIPGSSIFTQLRVADSLGQGKTDIDIIIVSGWHIDCIVVRNWTGELDHNTETDEFTLSSSGSLKQFDNQIKEAHRRSMLVKTFLNQCGVAVKDYHIIGRLLLTNPELKDISANSKIFNDSSVIRDVETFAKSFVNTWFWTFTDPVLPAIISGSISRSNLAATHMALAKLGTFDMMFLTGGRKLVGDYNGSSLLSVDRKLVEEVEMNTPSLGITGRLKSAMGFFPEVSCILWRRGGKGWFSWSRAKHSTILIPYNQTLPFKINGETQDALVPVNEIVRIIVSK